VIRIILLAILILLIARAFWRLVDGVLEVGGGTSRRRRGTPPVKLVRDPVCGTYVAPGTSLALRDGGEIYHFCSEQCRAEFTRR
jgi:YHS domain-containing protein